MADNIYWSENPVAQLTLPKSQYQSLQELAYAPQIMYQREQDTIAKLDAMNEAANTLNATLGDKAVVPQKFQAEYKSLLDDISKNGATSRNIDRASKLRGIYMSEVKPIEMFAQARAQKQAEHSKAAMDQNNLIIGERPTDVTFEQWRNDPSSMDFKVIGRDKLYTYGAKAGDEWKSGQLTKTTMDKYMRLHDQRGFANPQAVANAYQSDEKFRGLVEKNIQDIMAANGIPLNNSDAANAIRTGMMSQMVGEDKISHAPEAYFKGQSQSSISGLDNSPGFIDVNYTQKSPGKPFASTEDVSNYLLSDPSYNEKRPGFETLDERVRKLSYNPTLGKSEYSTYEELVKAQTKTKTPITSQYSGSTMLTPSVLGYTDTSRQGALLKNVNETFMANDLGSTEISPSWGKINQYMGDKAVTHYENMMKSYGKDIAKNFASFAGGKPGNPYRATDNYKEIVDKWIAPGSTNQEASIEAVNIDNQTGKAYLKLRVSSDNADKKKAIKNEEVYVEAPQNITYEITNMFTHPSGLGIGRNYGTAQMAPGENEESFQRRLASMPYNRVANSIGNMNKYYSIVEPTMARRMSEKQ